jgi:tetratricopeptide (TPR) repeat protein
MRYLLQGVVAACAGLCVPVALLSAPPQKGTAAKGGAQQGASEEQKGAQDSGGTPNASPSVVTEEMRSANEAASSSAEAAIASLKAARAAIAAEKSKDASNAGGVTETPAAHAPPPPAPGTANKKGKAVEKLESLPSGQEPPASAPVAAPSPVKADSRSGMPADVKSDLNALKTSLEEPKPPSQATPQREGSSSPKAPAPPNAAPALSPSTSAAPSQVAPVPSAAPAPAPGPAEAVDKKSVTSSGAVPPPPAEASAVVPPAEPQATDPAPAETKKKSRFGSDDALGDASKKKGKGKSKEAAVKLTPEQQKAMEIKAFCDKAREAIKRGEDEVARGLLESLVAVDLPHVEKKIALTEVAKVYEEKGDLTKAIAILEKLANVLEGDTEVPAWLLKLGQLYRDAGAYQMAVSRYYGVIQLSMKVGSSDFERFQGITRQAQREIANTYFIKGDFDQAQKFYNMALRSDLPKEERAVAMFRAAHCTFMRNDMNGAINALERFLKDYSRHASAAEARYMLATAFKIEGRPQDAYDTVIDLLRDAKSKSEENPKAWAFWQKKAGNEFANDYYQRGEFVNAVTIYQALAAIEESPEWRWPVVYQMGLCFERLRIDPRAAECYKYIVEESKRPEFRWRKMPQSVANLVEMAAWRVEQLAWDSDVHSKLRAVAGRDPRPLPKGLRP